MPEFFETQTTEEQPIEQVIDEKIKVGEKEYSQADLQRLVGLGEIGLEAETKYKTRIDRVWPNYQQVINEKKELADKLAVFETEKAVQHQKDLEDRVKQMEAGQNPTPLKTDEQPKPQFTAEQIREIAIKQAEELGIGPQAMRKTVMEVLDGQKLISDVSSVIDDMTADGLPSATIEDILTHMQETGIKNPTKAYKDLFETEYLERQAEKLASIKRAPGLPTIQQSTAGAKIPPQTPNFKRMKDDDLTKLINEAFAEGLAQ